MFAMVLWLKTWFVREEGQDLIEYVLIAGLVALAAVVAIGATGVAVNGVWEDVVAALPAVAP